MIETFASRALLADAAAEAVAEALSVPNAGPLVCAGGTTPGPVYDRLARRDLPWRRQVVTLTDERFVDPNSDDSNEKLIRERLLVGQAAKATFEPLKGAGPTPEADAAAAEGRLHRLLPFSIVLLGMGPDGHVASLFPGSKALATGLDLGNETLVVAVDEAGLKPLVPRISLTAHALTSAALIVVLISGNDKREVIEHIAGDPAYSPPAATILRQTRCPVRVLWAA